ncbi:MAG: transcriptional regulator NrdR [Christensenellales bacterium]|jgi:transcriptional repressor NrdR
MICPFCNYENSRVLDSRTTGASIRRRRECLACSKRFTTYETVETTPILVIKNDGSRQPFDAAKIKKGVIKACEKRPVSLSQIENIVSEIEKEIQNRLTGEVKSSLIGDMVMEKLKNLDEIAYIRFASVYRKFTDAGSFLNILKELKN